LVVQGSIVNLEKIGNENTQEIIVKPEEITHNEQRISTKDERSFETEEIKKTDILVREQFVREEKFEGHHLHKDQVQEKRKKASVPQEIEENDQKREEIEFKREVNTKEIKKVESKETNVPKEEKDTLENPKHSDSIQTKQEYNEIKKEEQIILEVEEKPQHLELRNESSLLEKSVEERETIQSEVKETVSTSEKVTQELLIRDNSNNKPTDIITSSVEKIEIFQDTREESKSEKILESEKNEKVSETIMKVKYSDEKRTNLLNNPETDKKALDDKKNIPTTSEIIDNNPKVLNQYKEVLKEEKVQPTDVRKEEVKQDQQIDLDESIDFLSEHVQEILLKQDLAEVKEEFKIQEPSKSTGQIKIDINKTEANDQPAQLITEKLLVSWECREKQEALEAISECKKELSRVILGSKPAEKLTGNKEDSFEINKSQEKVEKKDLEEVKQDFIKKHIDEEKQVAKIEAGPKSILLKSPSKEIQLPESQIESEEKESSQEENSRIIKIQRVTEEKIIECPVKLEVIKEEKEVEDDETHQEQSHERTIPRIPLPISKEQTPRQGNSEKAFIRLEEIKREEQKISDGERSSRSNRSIDGKKISKHVSFVEDDSHKNDLHKSMQHEQVVTPRSSANLAKSYFGNTLLSQFYQMSNSIYLKSPSVHRSRTSEKNDDESETSEYSKNFNKFYDNSVDLSQISNISHMNTNTDNSERNDLSFHDFNMNESLLHHESRSPSKKDLDLSTSNLRFGNDDNDSSKTSRSNRSIMYNMEEDDWKNVSMRDSIILRPSASASPRVDLRGSPEEYIYDVGTMFEENITRVDTLKKMDNQKGVIKLLKEIDAELEKHKHENLPKEEANNLIAYKIHAKNRLGVELYQKGDYKEVLEQSKQVLELDRTNVQALYKAYQAHSKLGNAEKSKAVLQVVRKLMQNPAIMQYNQKFMLDNLSLPSRTSSHKSFSLEDMMGSRLSNMSFGN